MTETVEKRKNVYSGSISEDYGRRWKEEELKKQT